MGYQLEESNFGQMWFTFFFSAPYTPWLSGDKIEYKCIKKTSEAPIFSMVEDVNLFLFEMPWEPC